MPRTLAEGLVHEATAGRLPSDELVKSLAQVQAMALRLQAAQVLHESQGTQVESLRAWYEQALEGPDGEEGHDDQAHSEA